jgi:hypothetical protein
MTHNGHWTKRFAQKRNPPRNLFQDYTFKLIRAIFPVYHFIPICRRYSHVHAFTAKADRGSVTTRAFQENPRIDPHPATREGQLVSSIGEMGDLNLPNSYSLLSISYGLICTCLISDLEIVFRFSANHWAKASRISADGSSLS